jgi:hypothetical protein
LFLIPHKNTLALKDPKVVFSPNSAFLAATTKPFRVGGGNDSLLKNKIYAVSSHDDDTKLFMAVASSPRSKQNEFLLQQNRILINYKKLTHFETCLMRSREFLKKNFDFIHAQIKAQAAASSSSTTTASLINTTTNNKEKQSKCQKTTTMTNETKRTKKKTKKAKTKKQAKIETKPTTGDEVDFVRDEKETNSVYSFEDFIVDDVKNDDYKNNTRIDFSRDMIEFTLKTLRVLSEIDEVLYISN